MNEDSYIKISSSELANRVDGLYEEIYKVCETRTYNNLLIHYEKYKEYDNVFVKLLKKFGIVFKKLDFDSWLKSVIKEFGHFESMFGNEFYCSRDGCTYHDILQKFKMMAKNTSGDIFLSCTDLKYLTYAEHKSKQEKTTIPEPVRSVLNRHPLI